MGSLWDAFEETRNDHENCGSSSHHGTDCLHVRLHVRPFIHSLTASINMILAWLQSDMHTLGIPLQATTKQPAGNQQQREPQPKCGRCGRGQTVELHSTILTMSSAVDGGGGTLSCRGMFNPRPHPVFLLMAIARRKLAGRPARKGSFQLFRSLIRDPCPCQTNKVAPRQDATSPAREVFR